MAIPPNGYFGFANQSQAVQMGTRAALGAVRRAAGRAVKRAVSRVSRKKRSVSGGAKRKKAARLVKGSAAAKAYMKKIRAKRK